MKIGDLVNVKKREIHRLPKSRGGQVGVIIDTIQMEDGFWNFEVMFDDGPYWFANLELEVINSA